MYTCVCDSFVGDVRPDEGRMHYSQCLHLFDVLDDPRMEGFAIFV